MRYFWKAHNLNNAGHSNFGTPPHWNSKFSPLFAVKSDLKSRVDNPKLALLPWLRRHDTVWLVTNNVGHGVLIFSRLHRSM